MEADGLVYAEWSRRTKARQGRINFPGVLQNWENPFDTPRAKRFRLEAFQRERYRILMQRQAWARRHPAMFDPMIDRFNARAKAILAVVAEGVATEGVTPESIAEFLGLDLADVTGVLVRMKRRGLVIDALGKWFPTADLFSIGSAA